MKTKKVRQSTIYPHINRAAIARKCGLSQPQVSRILSGKSSGSSASLMIISKETGVSLQELMGRRKIPVDNFR